jgi:hypothetical protein
VNQSFGSESLQVPFYALFAFFAVDRKCRFWVEPLTCLQVQVLPRQGMAGPSSVNAKHFAEGLSLLHHAASATALATQDWTLWMEMEPEVCPSPNHTNLLQLVEVAETFLTERFPRLPADSGVKNFLTGPSRFGWEIKRKLIWLGTKSYLFRWFFAKYVSKQDEGATVGVTDDFVCQESTAWSGLGAVDLLAGALEVPAEDRATLRT